MDGEAKRKLRARAQQLGVGATIGKDGLTEGALEEVRRQLEEQRLLKVRLLASAREGQTREDLARELAEGCAADLVEVRGNTVVLWRGKATRRRAPG
ncbi:MAG TPA: YhbY family RNA-binding protein [Candidatus Thermoplasmatota archaeon]|jgi:RNA-binding protein|nr:YhbY family RNA-binding protein [Candidatus Thermoplasmatota archaeon]